MATVVRRLWGQSFEGPSGVLDQSKARQSARSSPGPSNRGSEATLPAARTLEIDVVVSPLHAVQRLRRSCRQGEAYSSIKRTPPSIRSGDAVALGMAELVECPIHTPLREVARVFLRLGVISFGGPAAHVALMEEEIVRRRRWLTREKF